MQQLFINIRFRKWRATLPPSLESSATAEALDAVPELRGYVEELQAIALPKDFGADSPRIAIA